MNERRSHSFDEMAADAWVVVARVPRCLPDWPPSPPQPSRIGQQNREVELASVSVDAQPGTVAAIRRLLALGHERIVFICLSGSKRQQGSVRCSRDFFSPRRPRRC